MKLRIAAIVFFSIILLVSQVSEARRGFAIGVGPVGNFYTVNTLPILWPGAGGYTSFQYRFGEQTAFQAGFMITSQNGRNISAGDDGILFLGMPTLDLRYFFLANEPRFDPYIGVGTGFFILTEGSRKTGDNVNGGVGLGASVILGCDYYLTPAISMGLEGAFRTVGIITGGGTPSNSTAIFPFTIAANIAFHF